MEFTFWWSGVNDLYVHLVLESEHTGTHFQTKFSVDMDEM